MLPMLAPLAAFLLALPQTLAHPLSSLKRSDNGGNLLALWNGNPGPVYYSTSSHSCDKKSLAAVGTSFPLVLDIASYPYPSNLTSQTVLLNVGSYKKSPGQVFGIDWKVPQLGNQLFVFRLSDASGQVVYSDPTYTASGNSQPSSTDSGQSCHSKAVDVAFYTIMAILGFCFLLALCAPCIKQNRLDRVARKPAAPSQPAQPASQPAPQPAPPVATSDQESAYCESFRTTTSFSSTAPLTQTEEGRSWRLFGR